MPLSPKCPPSGGFIGGGDTHHSLQVAHSVGRERHTRPRKLNTDKRPSRSAAALMEPHAFDEAQSGATEQAGLQKREREQPKWTYLRRVTDQIPPAGSWGDPGTRDGVLFQV